MLTDVHVATLPSPASLQHLSSVGRWAEKSELLAASLCAGAPCGTVPSPASGLSGFVAAIADVDPNVLVKSAIKMLHLLGVVLGLGAATLLDLMILRFLVRGTITADHAKIVDFMSKVVFGGLVILWVSGIFYLVSYAVFDPVKLGNQKVWAKIVIVAMLTVNGYFIHHVVLPLVRRQVGRSLFDGLAVSQRSLLLTFGAVSVTSWYVPLALGVAAFLNFVLPATVILSAYAAIVGLAVATTQIVAYAIWRDEAVAAEAVGRRWRSGRRAVRRLVRAGAAGMEQAGAFAIGAPQPALIPVLAERRRPGPSPFG